ncbi:hypothetical protein [Aquimarina aquimarini]|uniref:hypothetical protein n=1 Tax=Aquimarina aquimarini TaxID=1191734 RepID=UPI000D55613E|nr:hypothetical protein [Aquimarina aquimarini]
MTIQEIISWFANNPNLILGYFAVIIILSLLGLAVVNQRNFKPPINYFYGMLVYAVTIPGLLALIIILYSFFFLKVNLLQVDVLAYFVPVISMFVTLFIINRTVPMSRIPGFDKLSGLFIIVAITFVITYIAQRMFFGVFFVGRFQYLIIFFLALLLILRIAWRKITK